MDIVTMTFSAKFPIRNFTTYEIEEIFGIMNDKYLKPNIIPIPDEVDVSFPRVRYQSINGHSVISISKISIDFSVFFDDEYKHDYNKCMEYTKERYGLIHNILNKLSINSILYCGLISTFQFPFVDIIEDKKIFMNEFNKNDLYDFDIKETQNINNVYYRNIQHANYRIYDGNVLNFNVSPIVTFAHAYVVNEGHQLTYDINDRCDYNNNGNSYSLNELDNRFGFLTKTLDDDYIDFIKNTGDKYGKKQQS